MLVLLTVTLAASASGQSVRQTLFPSLIDEALRKAVADTYAPVAVVYDGYEGAGRHVFEVGGRAWAPGSYFVRATVDRGAATLLVSVAR